MENKFIKRSYSLDGKTGEPIMEEYPSHLGWDGQHSGMEYLESQIHLLESIIHGALYKMDNKELTTEKALEIISEATGILGDIKTDLAWHSDGEPGDGDSYLMEAYYKRNSQYQNNSHDQLSELYTKLYPKQD